MKSSGKCPKCNSYKVYTNQGLPSRGDRSSLAVSSWVAMYVDVYICMQCGFVEEYVSQEDLTSDKKIAKIQSDWKKK